MKLLASVHNKTERAAQQKNKCDQEEFELFYVGLLVQRLIEMIRIVQFDVSGVGSTRTHQTTSIQD
jgi:hypothetical protein